MLLLVLVVLVVLLVLVQVLLLLSLLLSLLGLEFQRRVTQGPAVASPHRYGLAPLSNYTFFFQDVDQHLLSPNPSH